MDGALVVVGWFTLLLNGLNQHGSDRLVDDLTIHHSAHHVNDPIVVTEALEIATYYIASRTCSHKSSKANPICKKFVMCVSI